jgi:hypothetical protein
MTIKQPHAAALMKDEQMYLRDFQLAIDAIRGIAAENPALAARLNAAADKCQTGYEFLESAFWADARQRHEHRLKTNP